MRPHRYFIGCILLILVFCSCRNEKNFIGSWKPFEVKIWNNYRYDSLLINLHSKQFYFDHEDKEALDLFTPSYKDSLLKMLSASYLTLEDNGRFVMEDHAFFTQALDDTAWHNVVEGRWHIDDSLLTLSQLNGLTKCYIVLTFEAKTLIIGELFECKGRPITEISLKR